MRRSLLRYMVSIVRKLPDPVCQLPDDWRRAYLRREVRARISKRGPDWSPRHKVFGIGLARTGTTSLSHALEQLGYNSLHWALEGQVLSWPDFFWADAATDTPCSSQFEPLYHTFEGSKFIYTVRDVDSWSRSIADFTGMESPRAFRQEDRQRMRRRGEWDFHNTIHRARIHESLYAQHDTWKEAYKAFDERVQSFFADKPEDRLLQMSITDGDGWEPLCSFLGHEVPDCSFPHSSTRVRS